jgi:gliding motility associated protien GldN
MKSIKRYILIALATIAVATTANAQESSSSSVVRRSADSKARGNSSQVSQRMQQFYESDATTDADVQWMRIIYRELDLTKDANAPLYFPEEPIEGQENLFRIIMKLLAANEIKAYEYLDGREIFTDDYRIKVKDVLDRFYILYTEAKGSTEKNPKFTIEESDVPANEVLSYYIIEKWEFDTRSNRMKTRVTALCPVLHRSGDFGGEAIKYPMFWIQLDDLRPYLAQQAIFTNDDNNLATCTYDDYFNLTMYNGEIYKTRNLKNKSMMQLYPEEEDLKKAQDSIQNRLDTYEKKLWVPSREEVMAAREQRESLAAGDSTSITSPEKVSTTTTKRSSRRSTKSSTKTKQSTVKQTKTKTAKASSSSSATRSVRRTKQR